jgi:hypothetical protein
LTLWARAELLASARGPSKREEGPVHVGKSHANFVNEKLHRKFGLKKEKQKKKQKTSDVLS